MFGKSYCYEKECENIFTLYIFSKKKFIVRKIKMTKKNPAQNRSRRKSLRKKLELEKANLFLFIIYP